MTLHSKTDLAATHAAAVTIVRQAAQVLMQHFEGPLKQSFKQTPTDIVTEADRESEALIVTALLEHFPQHHIVGEEGAAVGAAADQAEYYWYIDPLDGTTNYANRIPFFAISMALTDRARRPQMGIVYNPVSDELFSAVIGQGATLNGKPIHVSSATTLAESVLASGFPYDQATSPENNLHQWGNFAARTRGLRRFGSAALDLCFVAAGRFDGYWEMKLKPWDYLAGLLCVQEAGGTVTDYTGDKSDALYNAGRVVASNGHIHDEMVAVLRL